MTKVNAHSVTFILLTIVVCHLLFSLCTSRARLSEKSVKQLVDGMSTAEASSVIGVPPAWYDGIIMLAGINTGDKETCRVAWLNLHGAIVADCEFAHQSQLNNFRFIPSDQYSFDYRQSKLVYDRIVNRAMFANGIATRFYFILLLSFAITIPVFAAAIFQKLTSIAFLLPL